MTGPIRIAMWSGPRNISTAMMRSFGSRDDTAVIDEPFYAAYLAATGLDHPMRAEVLAAQPTDWHDVVPHLTGPVPGDRRIFYQKHMAHHMLDGFGLDWMAQCRNAFLIRDPAAVLRSYQARRQSVTLADIGIVRQAELFDAECDRLGHAPPVVDAADILADPAAMLGALCAALGIGFSPRMLAWAAGPRATDGVWAPAWYGAVERSTGFARQESGGVVLDANGCDLVAAAQPFYGRMARWALAAKVGGDVPSPPNPPSFFRMGQG